MSIAKFQAMAIKAVTRWGGAGKITTKTNPQEYNGEVVYGINKEYPVKVAVFDYPQNGAGEKSDFNTLILEGDIQAFVIPDNCSRDILDIQANISVIEINNVVWRILNKKAISPNSIDVAVYDLHLRK